MRAIFFGTPEFAVPALEVVAAQFDLVAVITQQNKPVGRGRQLTPPPVKSRALELGIRCIQPRNLKGLSLGENGELISSTPETAELAAVLNQFSPIDISVVVAYGKIIPQPLLDFPKHGHLNIHASLLPRWRGAAPIHWALFSGDKETGVCLMKLEAGLDTGPVYVREKTLITEEETFASLHDRLSLLGAKLLRENATKIASGGCIPVAQPQEGVTLAPKWEKHDCIIDWREGAARTANRVRASSGATATFRGEQVKITAASVIEDRYLPKGAPGEIVELSRSEIVVATGDERYIQVDGIQFPGKKRLEAIAAINGYQIKKGEFFGAPEEEK